MTREFVSVKKFELYLNIDKTIKELMEEMTIKLTTTQKEKIKNEILELCFDKIGEIKYIMNNRNELITSLEDWTEYRACKIYATNINEKYDYMNMDLIVVEEMIRKVMEMLLKDNGFIKTLHKDDWYIVNIAG